ncbi:RNA-binding ribosome biosynthesis protein mak21, partial [Coemansia nantahalensis]
MASRARAAARGNRKQKAAPGDDGKELWEEIQKLGGDKADLELLRGVDDGTAGKPAKAAAASDASLHGDLADLVKSLGLATSAPEFADIVKQAPEKKAKAKADEKAAKPQPAADAAGNDAGNAKAKAKDKPTKELKAKDAEPKAKGRQAREPKAKGGEPKAKGKGPVPDDEAEPTPGFKIKSAKDAKPLGKGGRLVVRPAPQWFSIELDALTVDEDAAKPSEEEALQKLQFAEQLLERENELYEQGGLQQRSLSTADRSFVSNILSSGTLTDRVSALTLIVQESPVHNLRSLRQLMQMVQKKNRREALLAVGCVKDLMLLNLLPADRKLKHFVDQPIAAAGVTNAHWILWAFEDKLKRHYFDLIQVMEAMSYDPVLHTRQNMVAFFEDLLEKKPEQEQNLLRLLVNKLGDKERQLAAKASYLILRLLNAHPNMKHIVVRTIQELLLTRSSTKERAQYYTMITLNQVVLSSKDAATANLLLDVYFTFFKKLLGATAAADAEAEEPSAEGASKPAGPAAKKGAKQVRMGQKALRQAKEEAEKKRTEEERSMDNRLLAAILTGLNRALPFCQLEDSVMDRHIGTIFQIAHAGNFNTVVQSLVLLSQIARMRPAVSDRFYRTLYDSLLDPRLDQTSKKAMYLNVLFRALKADTDAARVMAFLKRIMQVCLYSQAELA